MVTVDSLKSYLEDRKYLLPYSEALAFSYLNDKHFTSKGRPTYTKYFKPFEEIKKKTFYSIRPESVLNGTFGDSGIMSMGIDNKFIVVGTLSLGLTDDEFAMITAFGNKRIDTLLNEYNINSFGVEDLRNELIRMSIYVNISEYLSTFNITITKKK